MLDVFCEADLLTEWLSGMLAVLCDARFVD